MSEVIIEILKKKLDIAIQGLDVINSMGDSMVKSVAQQTLDAMKDCEDPELGGRIPSEEYEICWEGLETV
jgi:hypothetical protein